MRKIEITGKAIVLPFLMLLFSLATKAQSLGFKVVDYLPAPGQFVNALPEYEDGDTKEDVLTKATEIFENSSLLHLGTYGGYAVFEFDEPVENKEGSDFLINGNAFYAASDAVYGDSTIGGSIEPGIVYVGVGDNLDDVVWYELAGSEYYTTELHDFSITYYKPTAETGEHSQFYSVYDNYIYYECSWTDPQTKQRCDSTGYHCKNSFHKQTYWPGWIDDETLTFSGGKLPNNAVEQSGKGTYWVQYRYSADAFGYVDAAPNSEDKLNPNAQGVNKYNTFDIDWAVDKDGIRIGEEIKSVKFVKVVCGIFQYCGWLGETSTEISKVQNLHLIDGYDDDPITWQIDWPEQSKRKPSYDRQVVVPSDDEAGTAYDLTGRHIANPKGIFVKNGKLMMKK